MNSIYRCPKYDNLPAECKLASDPNDPCCLAPKCNITDPNKIPTAAPGVISGIFNIPTPAPIPGGPTLAPKLYSKYKRKISNLLFSFLFLQVQNIVCTVPYLQNNIYVNFQIYLYFIIENYIFFLNMCVYRL